ncbi:pyridoxal phosphate-dependent transferase [Mycena olivaceomarginata]|nr:pyridoxal phosphate-dependent transferase [Mycena olivaceomarginata]
MAAVVSGVDMDVQFTSDLHVSSLSLDELEKKTGLDILIHVDSASDMFITPFVYPMYKWAFDLKHVHSINMSGHKFGLVYVGLGWILWKNEPMLHKDLIFELYDLESIKYSFILKFSKPTSPIITQVCHLATCYDGYHHIAIKDLRNMFMLSHALKAPYFTVFSNICKPSEKGCAQLKGPNTINEDNLELYEHGLPIVSFRLSRVGLQ